MNKLLQEEKEKLDFKEFVMGETCEWWVDRIQKKVAKFIYVSEKLKEQYSDELYNQYEELEREIKHLNLKKEWEERELRKLDKEKMAFEKKQKKDLMISLSHKLNKNIKPPQIS